MLWVTCVFLCWCLPFGNKLLSHRECRCKRDMLRSATTVIVPSCCPAEEADAEASLMDELDAEPAKKKRGRAKKKAVAEDPEEEEGSE